MYPKWIDEALPDIEAAKKLQKEIDRLYGELDMLLDPIAEIAVLSPDSELRQIIDLLPAGLHRSELRTILNRRKKA